MRYAALLYAVRDMESPHRPMLAVSVEPIRKSRASERAYRSYSRPASPLETGREELTVG